MCCCKNIKSDLDRARDMLVKAEEAAMENHHDPEARSRALAAVADGYRRLHATEVGL